MKFVLTNFISYMRTIVLSLLVSFLCNSFFSIGSMFHLGHPSIPTNLLTYNELLRYGKLATDSTKVQIHSIFRPDNERQ